MTTNQQLNWSPYQKKIFLDIAKGEGNTIIIARAGSSKTTSLIQGSRYLPKGKKTLFCAFNKSIQEELRKRLSSYVEVKTLHSLGFSGIKNKFPNAILNNNKCFEIVEGLVNDPKSNYDLIINICKTVHFCKMHLIDTPSKIEELIEEAGIDLCDLEISQFIKIVCKTLRLCKEKTSEVDFDDMLWFCFVYNIDVGKFDIVFIDEAQDMSKCAIELALSAKKKDGRVIAVLDNLQAIYSFMGADARVLDNLKSRLDPKELSLPISYRCPKKVIELAKKFAPDIQNFENAIDGEIIEIDVSDLEKYATPGSYVISRTNAPLIKHCFQFLKRGKKANILGRDIGDGLSYLIKKSKKKNIKSFLEWLKKWEKSEKEKYLAKRPNGNVDFIVDRAECLYNLCEDCSTLEEVKDNINSLFSDAEEKDIVLFSSTHKIKGKEADKVFLLKDTYRFNSQEEKNLYYVAITRTKQYLYFVNKNKIS
jgi:DNA helicase II / ATP-dependent DNA helicase PcrA